MREDARLSYTHPSTLFMWSSHDGSVESLLTRKFLLNR